MQARTRGAGAESPVEVVYVIPKEGAPLWIDFMSIPVDAPHPANAHAFLNYILEPEVIADISNTVGQANANAGALPFVKEELRNNPAVYPPGDVFKRLQLEQDWSADTTREITRAWTRVRTGQ